MTVATGIERKRVQLEEQGDRVAAEVAEIGDQHEEQEKAEVWNVVLR